MPLYSKGWGLFLYRCRQVGYSAARMKKLLIITLILFSSASFAQGVCADVETHPETRQKMSASEWQELSDEWAAEEPSNPGALVLLAAYALYSMEKEKANRLRGDKRKHCYMGCRIARNVSVKAAVYAAWLKEYEDLTDCNPRTYFEWRDYEVTVNGAEAGASMGNTGNCYDYCQNQPRR